MPELKPLPRTEKGLITLQEFVDPIYGSERYIVFKPEWVQDVEDKLLRLPFSPFRKKYPVTIITFVDGKVRRADGNWAEAIRAEQRAGQPEKVGSVTSA
jgi:hypothetical protein